MALRRSRLRVVACGVALALVHGTGCSWLFVHKAPHGPVEPAPPVECTSSVAAPVIDTTGTVLLGASGLLLAGYGAAANPGDGGWGGPTYGEQAALIGVGVAAVGAAVALGFSAASGYSNAAECRHLKEAQLSCVSGVEVSCQGLKERKQ